MADEQHPQAPDRALPSGVACMLHQFRHIYATELVNVGVSLATIRKRLEHKNLSTTLRHTEQSDVTADAELCARHRQHQARPLGHRRAGP